MIHLAYLVVKRGDYSHFDLEKALAREIGKLITENKNYFNSFDKIVIYYDNGQETLATILDTLFATNPNVERRTEFDHAKKRLFTTCYCVCSFTFFFFEKKERPYVFPS